MIELISKLTPETLNKSIASFIDAVEAYTENQKAQTALFRKLVEVIDQRTFNLNLHSDMINSNREPDDDIPF